MSHIKIVAEIGCNHNGDIKLAKKMIDLAMDCGVDAVKFQTFKASDLISKYAPKAEYQKKTTGEADSQLEMTAKLELSNNDYIELRNYAIKLGLEVFSTPFDMHSIDFLESLGQNVWKIPSGEITNLPYLRKIGSIKVDNKEVILSTGMATLGEISECINILEKSGTKKEMITILHCNTEYPTPDEDVNILAIKTLQEKYKGYRIGFSDHSVGAIAAIGASILGITMIEKHFTLDKNYAGPDHKASATPEELRELVNGVRRIEVMRGTGEKERTKSELPNMVVARKSIVAKCTIRKGEILNSDNITCKRPGNGINPMYWDKAVGSVANRDYEEDELIEIEGIEWQEQI